MADLFAFFIILVSGLFFSEVFKRLHLPYVIALIIAGILVGPYALNLVIVDETVTFLGAIGIIFLMFIAGSEVTSKSFKQTGKSVFVIAVLNSAIPFMVGLGIGYAFNLCFSTALVLGITFMSSSIAVIIPSLEAHNLVNTKLGRSIISSTVFEDVGSLLLIGFIFQSLKPKTAIPLFAYLPIVILFIILLKLVIPKLQRVYHYEKKGKDLFESKFRFVFVVLIATVLLFEVLGMHSIIAGFVIGLLLADSIQGKIRDKIRTISYGIFIPVFFLMLGVQTDLSVFVSQTSIALTVSIVIGLVLSKLFSGWLAGVLTHFSKKESLLIGFSTIPQLSTTLVVAYSALEFNIISHEIITSLVVLSMVTTLLAPLLVRLYVNYLKEETPMRK